MKPTVLATCLLAILTGLPAWTSAQSIQEIEARVAEQDAANRRDPYAHFDLAQRYAQMRDAQSRQKMLTHYRIAARLGHTDAQARLAQAFFGMADQPGVELLDAQRLRSEARALLEHAANAGNMGAMREISERLRTGDGIAKDEQGAIAWQRRLADQGDAPAAYALAMSLFAAPAGEQEAARYLRMAADQRHAPAVFDLAQRLETGHGIAPDMRAAREYAVLAVALKVPGAQEQLARIEQALAPLPRPWTQPSVRVAEHLHVENLRLPASSKPQYALAEQATITQDTPPEAVANTPADLNAQLQTPAPPSLAERAARAPKAAPAATSPVDGDMQKLQAQLAAIQAQLASLKNAQSAPAVGAVNPPSTQQPTVQGAALTFDAQPAQAGPEAGLSPTQINDKALAALRDQDMPTALRLFELAARRGDVNAMNNMGMLHLRGVGVVVNRDEAVRWFTQAADRGNAAAASNLGYIYANGVGVTADTALAINWYRRAASLGDLKSQDMLRALQGATGAVAWTQP